MNNDLISREALKKCARVVFDKDLGRLRVVDVSDIDNAPTVTIPNYDERRCRMKYIVDIKGEIEGDYEIIGKYGERPQGKWIDCSEDGYVECPFCGHLTTCEGNIDELHYCWNCGAEMKGGAK